MVHRAAVVLTFCGGPLGAWCSAPGAPGEPIPLVQGGKAAATLVVADEPLPIALQRRRGRPTVAYAAEELQRSIEKASGARLPVAAASKAPAHGTLVLVGSHDNALHCVDAASGRVAWIYETESYVNGAPAVSGGRAVIGGCDERIHAISVADGTKAAEIELGSYIPGSPAVVGDRVYVGHYGDKIVCADLSEKKIVWEYDAGEDGGGLFSSPAVGTVMYVPT